MIGTGVFLFIRKRNKEENPGSSLKEELDEVLKTSEDSQLIDAEVYGDLKRDVKLGRNNFTFTPHFLIQRFSETGFKVIKLQDVRMIKSHENGVNGYTEFFDEFNRIIGKIENSAFNSKTFTKVCEEQIPWAEYRDMT